MSHTISFKNADIKFEPKYIIQMINAILFNSWRGDQALSICMTYLEREALKKHRVGLKRMRKKLINATYSLQDYKYYLSIDMLGAISLRRYLSHHVQVTVSVLPPAQSVQEGAIVNFIAKLEINKKMSINCNQMTKFNSDENLKKI